MLASPLTRCRAAPASGSPCREFLELVADAPAGRHRRRAAAVPAGRETASSTAARALADHVGPADRPPGRALRRTHHHRPRARCHPGAGGIDPGPEGGGRRARRHGAPPAVSRRPPRGRRLMRRCLRGAAPPGPPRRLRPGQATPVERVTIPPAPRSARSPTAWPPTRSSSRAAGSGLLARLRGVERSVQAGVYELRRGSGAWRALTALQSRARWSPSASPSPEGLTLSGTWPTWPEDQLGIPSDSRAARRHRHRLRPAPRHSRREPRRVPPAGDLPACRPGPRRGSWSP